MMLANARRMLSSGVRTTGLIDAALIRFAVVGLITTTLDIALFYIFAASVGFHPVQANLASYSCGILTSFLLNRFWTFGDQARGGRVIQHGTRFLISNLAGLALSSMLVALLVLLLPPVPAKFASVPMVFVWNYLLARLWVFR
jgi:putative flippase GtrA